MSKRPVGATSLAACLLLIAWACAAVPASADQGEAEAGTDHWSFQPVTRPEPPAVQDADWARNPIDLFVLAELEKRGLRPSPQADRRTLMRRLHMVMHGLPPTPTQLRAFIDSDDPRAYEKLVEDVLASPRYGERWGRHWLDVVRYADTNGFETNTPRPNAWRYRDWVIAAFNEDKPYDQFVIEQLVGDAEGAGAATGFIVAGPYDVVKSPDVNLTLMQRQDELADMVNATSTAFLGLTVACARCHDHKFDAISQKDYYAMQAVFAGVQHGDRPVETAGSAARKAEAEQLKQRVAELRGELNALESQTHRAPPGDGDTARSTIMIDDETVLAEGASTSGAGVMLLAAKRGHGENPAGSSRGYKDDPGDFDRLPNVSGGRYTYWEGMAEKDLLAYRPAAAGRFRVWLSWGCGWDTHATDVKYVLDRDGDPATQDDQRIIAEVDQQCFADGTRHIERKPLWSGFRDVGVLELEQASTVIVRAGESDRPVTADVIVLQQAGKDDAPPPGVASLPRLRPAANAKHNIERFAPLEARFVRFNIEATNASEPCIDELEIFAHADGTAPRNVALASAGAKVTSSGDYQGNPKHKLEHINDGQYGNSRSWISNENGQGWVMIELPEPAVIDRIEWGRDRESQYADRLATRYTIEAAVQPGQWQTVASSRDRLAFDMPGVDASGGEPLAYRFAGLEREQAERAKALIDEVRSLEPRIAELSAMAVAYAGTFQQPQTTHLLYRGDPMAPRDPVAPDAVTAIGSLDLPMDTPEQQRRKALAKWIVSPDNPLTARVMVNRIWQYHFGEGIVRTPSDFGAMGVPPSHPQLLDWLAAEFMDNGWSVKHMHRLILSSATWRQSGAPRKEALAIDAGCENLWRFPPRRLEAEAVRDSVLAVTGVLDLTMGGPGFDTFKPNTNYVRVYIPKEQFGPAEWRRMVYMYRVRMENDATFGVFDSPDAGQVCPKRSASTTPLQAMNLLNSPFMMQQAELLAQRLQREAGDDAAAQVTRAFMLTFGRVPEAEESAAALKLIEAHGMEAFCRAMLNANEFLFVQ